MKSIDTDLLAAMAEDCRGRSKVVAAEAFPSLSVPTAEGELSNILAGRRRMTAAVLREITADPERTATLSYLAARAGLRLERVRRDPGELLDQVVARQAQIEMDLRDQSQQITELIDAYGREREKRGPLRAAPAATRRQGAA